MQRVEVIHGDLEKKYFGLSINVFRDIGDRTDVIIHNGCAVNGVLPYIALRRGNVGGTLEVIRMASLSKNCPRICYISSLSSFGRRGGPHLEEFDRFFPSEFEGMSGYGSSKRISETLVCDAFNLGTNIFHQEVLS